MGTVGELLAGLMGRTMSRDRLFRLGTYQFLAGDSRENIVQTFMAYGQSKEEASASYDRIVEVSSKVTVRHVRVHDE